MTALSLVLIGCPCGAPPGVTCSHSACIMRQLPPGALIRRGVYLPRLYGVLGREVIDSDGQHVTYRQIAPASLRTSQRASDTAERFSAWIKLTGAVRQEQPVGEA